MNIKNTKYKIVLAVAYIAMLLPFLYAVFYSMPANDDFAWAIEWFSSNRLVEVVKRVDWNYNNFFGQSGVIALIIQVLFNPLYWFKDAGHSFGICMCIVFLGLYIGYIFSIKRIGIFLFGLEEKKASFFAFLTMLILFTTYYYADVYNWWSGMPGYSLLMLFMFIFCGTTAKYFKYGNKKDYIRLIVWGVITCTGMMNCVAAGLFYLACAFVLFKDNKDSLKKKIIPFVLFVISGVVTVVAPGNFKRTGIKEGNPDYIGGLKVTFIDLITRIVDTLVHKPWVLALLVLIVVLGINAQQSRKVKLVNIVLGTLCVIISAFGAIYPYIVGERKVVGAELATRINFVEDYILMVGFAIIAFSFGCYLRQISSEKIREKLKYAGYILAVACVVLSVAKGTIKQVVPVDIVAQRETIKELFYIWDDIMDEIEHSDGGDVVIERHNVPWTQYVYVVGIDDGVKNDLKWAEEYYGVCNYCVAKWYDQKSVKVFIYND